MRTETLARALVLLAALTAPAAAFAPHALPAPPPAGAPPPCLPAAAPAPPRPPAPWGWSGAMLNWPDMKIAPFTPTPLGPYSSGRPMYVPSGPLPAECAQMNMRSGLPLYLEMLACSH